MGFVNYKAKENSRKCEECRFNFINTNTKIGDKGYMHYLNLDGVVNKAIVKSTQGAMWAACKVCPNKKDFEKMYGVDPLTYYSGALG